MSTSSWQSDAKGKWNERAGMWHSKSADMWDRGSRKSVVPFFVKHIEKESLVADLGCGDGYGSQKLHREGYTVTGIDLSNKMMELAKRFEGKGLSFKQGDLSQLPFTTGQLDAALAINSIEWTEQPWQVLKEVHRVLKPGGKLCAAILGPTAGPRENSYERLNGKAVIMNTMMPWEFERLAEEQGFEEIEQHYVYRDSAATINVESLPAELKQSLTFFTLFMLRKC